VKGGKALSKQEIVDKMQKVYGGSEKEAPFWTNGYCTLLMAMGLMAKDDAGKFTYTGG